MAMMINSPSFTNSPTSPYQQPSHNSSAPTLSFFNAPVAPVNLRSTTAPPGKRKEIVWAPNCAVYHTFHQSEYDRRKYSFCRFPTGKNDADALWFDDLRRLGTRHL